MATLIPAPHPGEYKPYAIAYVSLVPEGARIVEVLQAGAEVTEELVRSYPAERLTTPHAPGEWTIQDVLQHITDQERVFAYRVLCIARGDRSNLPGFDQDEYAAAARANQRSLDDLLAEYHSVRAATLTLVAGLPEAVLSNTGISDGHPLSVRAGIFIIAGHERYHLESLQTNYG
jgi:hypothetical protein